MRIACLFLVGTLAAWPAAAEEPAGALMEITGTPKPLTIPRTADSVTGLWVRLNIKDPSEDRDMCVLAASVRSDGSANNDDCAIMYRASDKSFVFPAGFSFRVTHSPPASP